MADINFKTSSKNPIEHQGVTSQMSETLEQNVLHYDLIELLFFAYRDFTSDPDVELATYDFGRAHHRVLHFVDRNPGMMVTDLLAILQITKQSLGRVLKQLVDKDFIEQRPGAMDRRQRLLYTTEKGHMLATSLSVPQSERLDKALAALPEGGRQIVSDFLLSIVDPGSREDVCRIIKKNQMGTLMRGSAFPSSFSEDKT